MELCPEDRHLHSVPEHLAALPKLFIYWADIDLDAYVDLLESCKADYFIVNWDDEMPANEIELRSHLRMLALADVVMLPDTWWTEVIGHQIIRVASWLGVKYLDYEGTPVDSASLKQAS